MKVTEEYQKVYSKLPHRRKATISRQLAVYRLANKLFASGKSPVCQNCGLKGSFAFKSNGSRKFRGLQVAHLNQNPLDNDLNNLALMCKECHIKYDRDKRRPIVRIVI